jgi:hypothetical protein
LSKVPINSFKSIAWFGLNYSTSGFKVWSLTRSVRSIFVD